MAERPGDEPATNIVAPSLALPKGGGAIRGIGEKFAANAATGTGSMTVPIAISPGRAGFAPQLSLSYDSGAGNGAFGLGWTLSTPSITRKTDKGLPRYVDATESDTFLLSGADDLVPELDENLHRLVDTTAAPGYTIDRYRPRIEGLFARIERWTSDSGDVHWRSLSKDNVLTLYGATSESRIADPDDAARIFSWLICETRDDKGNAAHYAYVPEDGAGVDVTLAHEAHRGPANSLGRTANRYLKRVRYGNRVPLLDAQGRRPALLTAAQLDAADWMFEIVLDYDEGHITDAGQDAGGRPLVQASIDPVTAWALRGDAFSSYRAGYEVRTARRCRRILVFHHFADAAEVGTNCLVRSTELGYEQEARSTYSLLRTVTQSGYRRTGDVYLVGNRPPIEFDYSRPLLGDHVENVEGSDNLPAGIDEPTHVLVDLHGEGLTGVLSEQDGAWYYKRNLSPVNTGARLGSVEIVAARPSASLRQTQFLDLGGDGHPDLVDLDSPMDGYFEHDDEDGWLPFTALRSRPTRPLRDPDLRFVDLDGDGHADILITGDDVLIWHESLGADGFGPERRRPMALDERAGPRLTFSDEAESIFLADMTGDGLSDLVRMRNGEVVYWPNLGYGRFGAKVTMDRAPRFDSSDQYEPTRVRLADIDGSGPADLIYLHRNGIQLYFNHCGNAWTEAVPLPVGLPTDDAANIATADLHGDGTTCLIWSSPLPTDADRPLRCVRLTGPQKPHLLTSISNGMGSQTVVDYAPSTRFYLQDRAAGTPWRTRLPFPVQVVTQVQSLDRVSGNRFVSRYAYHHGYFDGTEREFRGFALVEQWDTEGIESAPDDDLDAASRVPPALTRTWFHNGAFDDHVSTLFASEYYREPGWDDAAAAAHLLPDTVLPSGLMVDEQREACRALKGSMLRKEVYGLDGTSEAVHPYLVTENNFTVEVEQRRGDNRHGVFFTHARETLSYQYERDPDDPRVAHALTLAVDPFGNVRRSLAVSYGRRPDRITLVGSDRDAQARLLATYTEADYTEPDPSVPADWVGAYRTPLPAETRTYEITGLSVAAGAVRLAFDQLAAADAAALSTLNEVAYEQPAAPGVSAKRLIESVRTLHRSNDLTRLLPLGQHGSLGLPGETYRLGYTPGIVTNVYRRGAEALLADPQLVLAGTGADGGGYVDLDADDSWWRPSGRSYFSPGVGDTAAQELAFARAHFFLAHRYVDPFGQPSVIGYDSDAVHPTRNNTLLLVRTQDPLGNTAEAVNDYRVVQARTLTDANGNRSSVAFDALGLVVGTAVMGKAAQVEGDSFDTFEPDLSAAEIAAYFAAADPRTLAETYLGTATTRIVYDLAHVPSGASSIVRETHVADLAPGAQSAVHVTFAYSDGFDREIQRKVQAEPGPVPKRAANGSIVVDGSGQPVLVDGGGAPRWVGSGWTVFDNKGNPVRSFEPFFSDTHAFDADVRIGVSPWRCYDPLGRVVATLRPDHTVEKVVFDPWQQANYDANDMVLNADGTTDPTNDPDVGSFFARLPAADRSPTWYEERIALPVSDPQRVAAEAAAVHRQTPTTADLDAMGRPFRTVVQNRFVRAGATIEESYSTRIELDIEGNHQRVGDANGRVAMRYDYDVLGNRIHQSSMDAGERWTVEDVRGKLIRAWDSRLRARRVEYDELRRPIGVFVTQNGSERLVEMTVYGEGQGVATNHRTRVYQSFDSAGVVTTTSYDFKGNALATQREVLSDHRLPFDWQTHPDLDGTAYPTTVTYDAMNRRRTVTTPDASVYRPSFTEGNLLQSIDVNVRGAQSTSVVSNIDYDAKGQRTHIDYANGASTNYDHDPLTWRLVRARTTRPADADATAAVLFTDPSVVGDSRYTYDPVGNVSAVADGAALTVFFDNQQVVPGSRYVYDATYRLIGTGGREHVGQTTQAPTPANRRDFDLAGLADLVAHPNDTGALRTYTERYEYDAADNLTSVRHVTGADVWTRTYDYAEPSPLDAGMMSNRLSSTTVGARVETYGYADADGHDACGCITGMGSLTLDWDANDHLATADLGGGGIAYYAYDASGRRVRKVVDDQNGNPRSETIYVGGYEIHRTFGANPSSYESLHVMDDTRRIALIETPSGGSSALRYQLGDHLGSTVVELDAAAALISYEEYHPFGTSSFQAGRSVAEVSLKRYRFTGEERDEETGFSYHRARYCAPWLGRWVSADPAGLVDGPNLYRYARNNPVRLNDPGGTDPPRVDQSSPRVTPILTDVELTGVSGKFQLHDVFSSDRSVSGSGTIGLRARAGLLVDVPQLDLHTSGLVNGTATIGVDTSLGRAGIIAQGGLLLGDLNGFNLTVNGSGSLRTTVPERIPLGSVTDTLTAGLPTAEGSLRLHGEVASGRTSLLRFDADGALANGAFSGRLDATSILNVGRLHGSVTGHVDPGGSVTLDSAQLRASATVPGLSVTANARGVGDGRGGLDVTADASVRLFGLQSLRAQGTGNVSANGASLAGTFSGPGPLYSSYILGDFNLNTRGGNSVNATVLGLGYTPSIKLDEPASPPPGNALGSPRTPWAPGGLSIGVTRFNYSQGNLNYLSVGVFPDLSSNLLSNFQFGGVYSTSF